MGYIEGLEEDAQDIFNYFGQDFLTPQRAKKKYCLGTVPGTVGGLFC